MNSPIRMKDRIIMGGPTSGPGPSENGKNTSLADSIFGPMVLGGEDSKEQDIDQLNIIIRENLIANSIQQFNEHDDSIVQVNRALFITRGNTRNSKLNSNTHDQT